MLDAIDQLKNGKAPGPDKVTVILVKDPREFIAHPLMLIYNSSHEHGVFPDIWKLARVTPMYKSGPKTDLNSYRQQLCKFVNDEKGGKMKYALFTKNYFAVLNMSVSYIFYDRGFF